MNLTFHLEFKSIDEAFKVFRFLLCHDSNIDKTVITELSIESATLIEESGATNHSTKAPAGHIDPEQIDLAALANEEHDRRNSERDRILAELGKADAIEAAYQVEKERKAKDLKEQPPSDATAICALDECGKPFIKTGRSPFCTPKCAKRFQNIKYRDNKKAQAGKGPGQIVDNADAKEFTQAQPEPEPEKKKTLNPLSPLAKKHR